MFAVKFDDLQRKLIARDPRIFLNKLFTGNPGTAEYDAYLSAFLLEENSTIELLVEDDKTTSTFYTVVTNPKDIDFYLQRKADNDNARFNGNSTPDSGSGSFV